MDDEVQAPRYVNPTYRQRRALPPSSQPAIAHPATAAAIRLRLVFSAVLVLAALGLAAGAFAVARHRSARKQELLRTGLAVSGRVVAQPFDAIGSGSYWADDVQWSFAGQRYDDSTTLTSSHRSDLPSMGATVTVLVDRHDPSWFAIDGVFTGRTSSSVSLALLVVPDVIALLLALGLGWRGVRLRSVTRRHPWRLATIAEVRRVLRRNGRLRYTECEIAGEDSHLPVTVRSFGGEQGTPVWVCFGDRSYAICRPGAFGLRCLQYRS